MYFINENLEILVFLCYLGNSRLQSLNF